MDILWLNMQMLNHQFHITRLRLSSFKLMGHRANILSHKGKIYWGRSLLHNSQLWEAIDNQFQEGIVCIYDLVDSYKAKLACTKNQNNKQAILCHNFHIHFQYIIDTLYFQGKGEPSMQKGLPHYFCCNFVRKHPNCPNSHKASTVYFQDIQPWEHKIHLHHSF